MSDARSGASTAKAPESNMAVQAPVEPERQRFDELLQRLGQEAQAQGQENPVVSVQAGRPVIYKGVPGQDPVSENIPIEAIQKVLQAVEEPQSLNGTVKLSVDRKVAFYNQKGEVSQDAYHLASQGQQAQDAQSAPESVTQPPQVQPSLVSPQPQASSQQQPEAAQPPKLEATAELEGLKTQIAQLESLVAKQQRQIHQLDQRSNLIASAPILNVNNKLGNWLEDIRGKVGNTLQQTSHQVSSRVQKDTALLDSYRARAQELVKSTQAKIGEVKQTATEFVGSAQAKLGEVKQVATETVQATRDQVNATGNQVATAYDQAVDRHYAAHNAVGQVVAGAARNVSTAALHVATKLEGQNKERPVPDAKALWNHYSSQSASKGPFQTAAAVARNAVNDKLPEAQIRQILSANPSMEQFGAKGRRELVEQPLEKAKRELALSQQPSQQTRQQGKESSLSR